MNSEGGEDNRPDKFRSNTGTQLLPKQREIIKKTVTEQQKATTQQTQGKKI